MPLPVLSAGVASTHSPGSTQTPGSLVAEGAANSLARVNSFTVYTTLSAPRFPVSAEAANNPGCIWTLKT